MAIIDNINGQWEVTPEGEDIILHTADTYLDKDIVIIPKEEQSKTLTLGAAAPATVTPDSGKVLSSVPVVLDTSVIKAENIAKDVTMLGVTGTHEGGGGGAQSCTLRCSNSKGYSYEFLLYYTDTQGVLKDDYVGYMDDKQYTDVSKNSIIIIIGTDNQVGPPSGINLHRLDIGHNVGYVDAYQIIGDAKIELKW